MSMNGGYTLIDCRGLDLTSAEEQTKPGIYAQLKTAMVIGKPLIGCNCYWGSGKPLTPIHFFANQYAENLIVCTSSILNINVTSADKITVQNLVG